jgi:hypothetical protein
MTNLRIIHRHSCAGPTLLSFTCIFSHIPLITEIFSHAAYQDQKYTPYFTWIHIQCSTPAAMIMKAIFLSFDPASSFQMALESEFI